MEKILQFVLFNPSEVNSNSFECLPPENIITNDEEVTSTVKKIVNTEDGNRKKVSSARRGRPRLKPVTDTVLRERRNVRLFDQETPELQN